MPVDGITAIDETTGYRTNDRLRGGGPTHHPPMACDVSSVVGLVGHTSPAHGAARYCALCLIQSQRIPFTQFSSTSTAV